MSAVREEFSLTQLGFASFIPTPFGSQSEPKLIKDSVSGRGKESTVAGKS
jgi:hypothetical protein